MGLLVWRQAGRDRHHRSLRQADGKGRRCSRRRLLLGPHGQYRRLEFGHGRRPLSDPALERVHHVMTIVPATLQVRPLIGRLRRPGWRLPDWTASWLQVGPLALVLILLFALPT